MRTRQRYLLILLGAFLLVLACSGALATPVNLLYDGGLNNSWTVCANPGSGTADGWNWSVAGYAGYIWSESGFAAPNHYYEGGNALRMCGYDNLTTQTFDAWIWQDVPVVSGTSYDAWAASYNEEDSAGHWVIYVDYAGMKLQELDANKNVIVDHSELTYADKTTWWVGYAQTIVTNPKTCFIRFKLHTYLTGDNRYQCHVTWDAASLVPSAVSRNWLQYRGDRRLTGRSPLKGNITSPSTKWSKWVGSRETLLSTYFGGSGSGSPNLPTTDSGNFYQTEWDWGYPAGGYYYVALDGDGQLNDYEVPDYNHKLGDFTGSTGLEKVYFDSSFSVSPAYGHLYSRSGGNWVQSWQTPDSISGSYISNCIVGDFDNDGQLEIANQRWDTGNNVGKLQVRRMSDGSQKYTEVTCTAAGAESGRTYGLLTAADVDGDGKTEFYCFGDFQSFISGVGWNGAALREMWAYNIETNLVNKQTIQKTPTNPVVNVDGDSAKEVITNVYNWTPSGGIGDGHWHVLVLNSSNGAVKLDLSDKFCSGLVDLDNDGRYEILTTPTSGKSILENGTLTIYRWNGASIASWYTISGEAYQMQPLEDFPLNTNSSAATGRSTLLSGPITAGGYPVFVTRKIASEADRLAGTVTLTYWKYNGSTIASLGSVQGPNAEALALRVPPSGNQCALAHTTVPLNETKSYTWSAGAQAATVEASLTGGIPVTPATVARLSPSDAKATVVVQGAAQRSIAFEASSTGTKKWELPGRGQYTGGALAGYWYEGGLLLADVDGDGNLEAVTAQKALNGQARLSATRADGSVVWNRDFDFQGGEPVWNDSGITMFFAGHFTTTSREDILVTLRRSSMHTDETYLLNGTNGNTVWSRTTSTNGGGYLRACGGYWMSAFDYDGDGLDDAICLYPDVIFVMKGTNGNILLGVDTANIFGAASATALPVVDSFLSDGTRAVLYGTNTSRLGVLNTNGTLKWSESSSGKEPLLPAVLADIDGNGHLELIAPGYHDDPGDIDSHWMRNYNPDTGGVNWNFTAWSGYYGGSPVSLDINGDGKDEVLVVWDNVLYCAGTDASNNPILKWTWAAPSGTYLGSPAVVDVDDNGYAEIVVTCSNGYVYCIGQ